jgi:hypothetical protein
MLPDGRKLKFQFVRHPYIIRVQERDKVATCRVDTHISRCRCSCVALAAQVSHARILYRANNSGSIVGGRIIRDNYLDISVCLPGNAFDSPANQIGPIERRYNNTDQRFCLQTCHA